MGQLADQIAQGIKDAMRAKDRDRLAALRDIKSKLMLEATKDGASDDVDDATTLAILSKLLKQRTDCLLYTSPSPRDLSTSRMPSSA